MESSPITSWQIKREKVEAVTDFLFLGYKITTDSDWSHQIKRWQTWRAYWKAETSLCWQRCVCIVKAMVFPVVMYKNENWTTKKAECWRIDGVLSCWRRLLRVPWTVRRSNQSILKKIIPEYSLEGLMIKLKLQCFVHLMWRANSLEKTLMLGKIEGRRRKEDELAGWHHWLSEH